MIRDFQRELDNLNKFYDFKNKKIVHVGAGGAQLFSYTSVASKVWAVDIDKEAIKVLQERIIKEKFSVIEDDFLNTSLDAEVVLFEFCLHEMKNPFASIQKAKEIASEVVIIDHNEDSPWAWYICETEKAKSAWDAVKKMEVDKVKHFEAVQFFSNYKELYEKVKVMGDESIFRISKFKDLSDIEIPFQYQAALIKS